jgi:predicted nucleotidyltransferase
MKRDEVLAILRAHQQEIQSLGIISLQLFGSVARDEAKSNSDVDLLADLEQTISLFQFIKAKFFLQDLLNCRVDLGTKDALKEHLRQSVLGDSVYVF